MSGIIADSQREINSVETRKNSWEEDGFVKDTHLQEYVSHGRVKGGQLLTSFVFQNELVGICSENLSTIIEVLRTKDLQETFVSKKKSREMRCECEIIQKTVSHLDDISVLLNKWERLHNRIKENVQQTGVYGALKQDVISFKRDLAGLLERTEEPGHTDEDEELESRLHTFKVICCHFFHSLHQLLITNC